MERSDRSEEPVRPVTVQNGDDPTNAHPGGTPSGQALSNGRPARASSNAMEMREEEHIEIEKVRVKKKRKDDKSRLI